MKQGEAPSTVPELVGRNIKAKSFGPATSVLTAAGLQVGGELVRQGLSGQGLHPVDAAKSLVSWQFVGSTSGFILAERVAANAIGALIPVPGVAADLTTRRRAFAQRRERAGYQRDARERDLSRGQVRPPAPSAQRRTRSARRVFQRLGRPSPSSRARGAAAPAAWTSTAAPSRRASSRSARGSRRRRPTVRPRPAARAAARPSPRSPRARARPPPPAPAHRSDRAAPASGWRGRRPAAIRWGACRQCSWAPVCCRAPRGTVGGPRGASV